MCASSGFVGGCESEIEILSLMIRKNLMVPCLWWSKGHFKLKYGLNWSKEIQWSPGIWWFKGNFNWKYGLWQSKGLRWYLHLHIDRWTSLCITFFIFSQDTMLNQKYIRNTNLIKNVNVKEHEMILMNMSSIKYRGWICGEGKHLFGKEKWRRWRWKIFRDQIIFAEGWKWQNEVWMQKHCNL